MPVIGGSKGSDKRPVETEMTIHAEIGIAVGMEMARYKATLREIESNSEQRKLAAQRMFADRIEAIVQRMRPVISGPIQEGVTTDATGE